MITRPELRFVTGAVLALTLWAAARPAAAQTESPTDTRPAFSLSSGHVSTTREHPAIELRFRRVRSLDFRVYRVDDPLKFFANLREPHALGSEAPIVPQEQTVLERVARWKADMRDTIQSFVRGQFSYGYRRVKKESEAKKQIALRQALDVRQFAQVPVLNKTQIVTSWREMLPNVRESEFRRIPLELPGEGVYVVEAVSAPFRAYTVVMVSDLGLVTKAAPGQIVMFAANRFTGEPAAGCDAEVLANKSVISSGKLGPDGTFESRLPAPKPEDVVAIARCGKQVAASDPGGWFLDERLADLMAFIYTDKPIYRPGHTVNVKGVLRWRKESALIPFDRKQVEISIVDPNEKVVYRQQASVDEFGAVFATFPVPKGAALGFYGVHINSDDANASGSFEVQEYRKPEFEVIVKPAARFAMQGTQALASVSARYYFGQPVANATIKYVVHRQAYYSPLRWSDEGDDEPGREPGWYGGQEDFEGTARLNEQGLADLTVPLEVNENGRDYSVRIEARVTDASSREVSGNTIVHATFGRFMLVADSDSYSYKPGGQATLNVRAVDYVGKEMPNIPVTVSLEELTYEKGRYDKPTEKRLSSGAVTTDAQGHASWSVTLPTAAGEYRLRAETQVDGRRVTDYAWAWVSGVGSMFGDDDSERSFQLILDKKEYAPGDIAHVSIKGNVSPKAMLVTKEAQHVMWRQVVTPANGALSFDVPVADGDVGDIYVNVAFLKDDNLYRAEKRLKVPAASKRLVLTVVADQAVSKPRQPASFTVKATDAAGKPVRAQVSLGVIDEAVYGVKPDQTTDPLRFFYRREYSRVTTDFSREYYFTGYSGTQQLLLAQQRRRPTTLTDFKAERPPQPQVRKEFPDAIYWTGNIVTGSDGTARVQLQYPDSLTTWRLTARAVTTDTLVGATVARTTVTKDLIVRIITPRYLTEGDEAVIPTIVHNYLPASKSVKVSMKADGVAVAPNQPPLATQTIEVAQAGEHRDDWRFAANRVGTATFTSTATTDVDGDAVELSIPVLPFGLKRNAGAAGSMVGGGEKSAKLTIPASANPAARSIRVSLASSLAGPLLGALDFLTGYPYGCTEQTLSSFVPDVLVLKALDQLKIAPTERMKSLDRQVSQGLERLYDYQHEDGGWGWWKTDENHPFMTAYAVYGIVEAKNAGYKVEGYRLSRGVASLAKQFAEYPRAMPDLKAYMAYVLALAESGMSSDGVMAPKPTATDAIEQTWPTRDRMSPYGQALLLLALDLKKDKRGNDLVASLTASAQKTGDLVFWKSEHDAMLLDDFGDTSVEATAYAVKALAARDPNNPLLEPAVRWMLLNRNYGAWWSSTKQTAMALYGLLDYMRARKEGTGESTVEVLVNGKSIGTQTFTAASLTAPDPVIFTAPANDGDNTVVVRQKGAGAVYWAATAEYFDTAGPMERTGSRKLALVRKYFSLTPVRENDRIVYRETPFNGQAKPGDLILVRLDAAGANDWRYLMIEDPLPAGVEAVQQRSLYTLEKPREFWDGSRREYRDDRVVFFQESFTSGHYQYIYLLKVTTPGTFRAMPAQISAMYVPGATASSEPQTLTVAGETPRPAGATK